MPLRHYSPLVRYCGDFYGQDGAGVSYPEWISAATLIELLTTLPAKKAKASLKRSKKVKLSLSATVAGASGKPVKLTKAVTLK